MKVVLAAFALSTALIPSSASSRRCKLDWKMAVRGAVHRPARWLCLHHAIRLEPQRRKRHPSASRAWIDYPGHIWVNRTNEGAIYSPDDLTPLQFDRGHAFRSTLRNYRPAPPREAADSSG